MNPVLKVAILGCRGIPAKYGGFETFAEELSVRLAESGFKVDVFCEADTKKPEETYRGVGLIFVRRYRIGSLTTLFFDVACFWKARKSYDLVYMLGYGAGFFAFVPRIWGTRVWINMDGIEWARSKWSPLAQRWFRLMEWAAMRTASRVIADADAIRTHLLDRHGAQRPCSVIAYGAYPITQEPNPALLGEWGLESQDYFLVVCRLEPENHVLEVVRGFVASASRRLLVIVGECRNPGPYVANLLSIKDPRIRFIGTVFDKEKLACLRYHCFAYFHGHSVGGTNPSLLEAMGCGNLVIAHDNVFNREVLGETGLFFKDQGVIPAAIAKVEDPRWDSRPFKAGTRKRMEDDYSWDRISRQYLELIRREIPWSRISQT